MIIARHNGAGDGGGDISNTGIDKHIGRAARHGNEYCAAAKRIIVDAGVHGENVAVAATGAWCAWLGEAAVTHQA